MIASTQINTEFINIKDNMTLPLIKTEINQWDRFT